MDKYGKKIKQFVIVSYTRKWNVEYGMYRNKELKYGFHDFCALNIECAPCEHATPFIYCYIKISFMGDLKC